MKASQQLSWMNLPDFLVLEVLFNLTLTERIHVIRVSKSLHSKFAKHVRHITLKTKNLTQYILSPPFRRLIEDLISNTSRQISWKVFEISQEVVDLFAIPPTQETKLFTTKLLKIPVQFCRTSHLLEYFSKIEELCLEPDIFTLQMMEVEQILGTPPDPTYLSSLQHLLQSIADRAEMLGLQALSLYSLDPIDSIPIMHQLKSLSLSSFSKITCQSLRLAEFSQLRSLTLIRCNGIVDISCLDGLYELTIKECKNIEDISCLHNNHNITIKRCIGIQDYSRSFSHSRHIKISAEVRGCTIDVNNLQEVVSLKLFDVNIRNTPLPKQLKVFSLQYYSNGNVEFPINSLQELKLSGYPGLKSCHNLSSLQRLTLWCLDIPSLDGLGPNMQEVKIGHCNAISDFSQIKHAKRVRIDSCQHFIDSRIFMNVEQVIVDFNVPVFNAEGVTELRLGISYPNIKILGNLKRCKTIDFSVYDIKLIEKISLLLVDLVRFYIQLEKVVIHCLKQDISRVKTLYDPLQEEFILEIPFTQDLIILLRKRR